ncbi:MAG: hypothetical protein M3P04_05145 [Actinomycetota bacterium]|nr:hypothetical protein [Actinomycetota bacterium]
MTRPSPQEIVDGLRRMLKEVVEPELHSEHARQRLAEGRAVLAQVDWDDAGLHLARRTEDLRSALAEMRTVGVAIPDGVLDQPLGASYEVLSRQHNACCSALIALLPKLEDPTLTPARTALLATLLGEQEP